MSSLVKEIVLDILSEKKEKKSQGTVGIEASTGSGRFTKGVNEAGALANENPEQLMDNLGVKSAFGESDLEKIESLLKQAFTGTDAMKQVYTSFSRITNDDKQGLKVEVSVIKPREGIKYLYHTLVGAKNAGVLSLSKIVQIENFAGSIIIYNGRKKSWN